MTTLAIYTGVAIDTSGNAISGADVEVRLESSGALASLYSDEAATTPLSNPATALTDSNGRFAFYVAGADRGYSVKVTKAADTYTLHNQAIGTAGQLDQSAVVLKADFATASFNLIGGYLDWTVAGSVLTIAVKTWAGNNPSATAPVFIAFRSATPATGLPVLRTLTAATSISINSTALLGTVNTVPFRIWCVAFDDAGTVRLAVINCLSSAAGAGTGRDVTAIYALSGWGIATSVLEDNASDSAQVFYSDTAAVTAKAYATLGYGAWEGGLATAGTWSAAPTRNHLWRHGDPLPGQLIQVQRNDTGAFATGTTQIPFDDTIPQNTEGDQYMSQAMTPSSAANALRIDVAWNGSPGGSGHLTVALFQDAVANALKAVSVSGVDEALIGPVLGAMILAAGTAATTFKVRAGANVAGTTEFNGRTASRQLAGVLASHLAVSELMA